MKKSCDFFYVRHSMSQNNIMQHILNISPTLRMDKEAFLHLITPTIACYNFWCHASCMGLTMGCHSYRIGYLLRRERRSIAGAEVLSCLCLVVIM